MFETSNTNNTKENTLPDSTPPDPSTLERAPTTTVHYTLSTRRQRTYLTYLLGFLSLPSSLTATIYFPLIPLLSDHFAVSIQAINLTITLYVVFQAVAPVVFAPLSDSLGRRPVLLFMLVLYTAASLGLAFNDSSYAILLLLRALQSFGGSAVLAIAYGVVADVAVPAERGKMLGPMLAAGNLGPCVGPVIGGSVALASGEFRWCFWALLIFAVAALMLVGWTMPETARKVVGNMGVSARSWWKTWWALSATLISRQSRTSNNTVPTRPEIMEISQLHVYRRSEFEQDQTPSGKGTFTVQNPVMSVRIIFWKDTALILWLGASSYAVWYCIQTSIPLIYKNIYNFNDLEVGLCYLTGGAGVLVGSFVAGQLLDRNYKVVAKSAGFTVNTVSGDNVHLFPIESARSRGTIYLATLSGASLVGYGWAVTYHAHPSIPLVLQSLIGTICTIILQVFNTLLVDIFPENPSTAAASGNITRCGLSAVAIVVVDPLVRAMGYGWFFTMVAVINSTSGGTAILLIRRYGMCWRQKRASN